MARTWVVGVMVRKTTVLLPGRGGVCASLGYFMHTLNMLKDPSSQP